MVKLRKQSNLVSLSTIIIIVISLLLLNISIENFVIKSNALSTWTQTSDTDFQSGELENLTIMGNGKDAALSLNFSKAELHDWNKVLSKDSPTQRDNNRMASINGTDKIVHYGGYSGGINLNDTWIFDLSDNNWNRVYPSTDPGRRNDHDMESIYTDDKIVLFGGYSGSYYGDTWEYCFGNNSWTNKNPSGNTPAARDDHAMASIWGDDKVLIFGGDSGGSPYSDTWVYDLSNNTWTRKWPASNPASRESLAMASVYGTNAVVLFGGLSSSSLRLDDTWIYYLNNNTWIRRYPNPKPSARYRHGMVSIPGTDNVLLFGGNDDNSYDDETWIYSVGNNTWSKISSSQKPGERNAYAISSFSQMYKILLFGGYGFSGYFNDTWIYNPRSYFGDGSYKSPPEDLMANSTFKTFIWRGVSSANTYVHFQLRTGSDLNDLNSKSFVGPDGNITTFYTNKQENIWTGHKGDRWIQMIAFLNTSSSFITPIIRNITVEYNCLTETILVNPINGSVIANDKPTFIWSYNDVDSTQQLSFRVLIDNNSEFQNFHYDSGEQQITETQWKFPNGTGYSIIPDGIWYWKVHTKDPDGDWGPYSEPGMFMVDITSPLSAFTIPKHDGIYSELNNITGVSSDRESGSGVNKVEISIQQLGTNHYWDGTDWRPFKSWLQVSGTINWSYDSSGILWTSGGNYRIQSRAIDNATNIEYPERSLNFTIDMAKPTSNITIPKHESYVNNLTKITGSAYDLDGAGIGNVEISIRRLSDNKYWDDADWVSKPSWIITNGTNEWRYDCTKVDWLSNIRYNIRSRAIDNVENTELISAGISFMYDDEPPEPVQILINNGDDYTNSVFVDLTIFSDDIGSGVAYTKISNDNFTWTEWMPYNITKKHVLPVITDGEITVYLLVMDNANNIAKSVNDTIIFDSKPPINLGMKINEDAQFTNYETVTLNITAFDSLSGLNAMCFSFDDINWSNWEMFSNEKVITLTPGDGQKTIYFKVSDNAGNIADDKNTIILDKTPPHSLSLKINNGSIETNKTLVRLDIKAEDDISGVDKLSLSDDGKSWGDWKDYHKKLAYILPTGEGKKSVYLRVIDKAGNIAEPISASIKLTKPDTNGPNGNDSNGDKPGPDDGDGKKSSGGIFDSSNMWWILLLIIIIIIVIAIVGIVYSKRRKQKDKLVRQVPAITVKPSDVPTPVITVEQEYLGTVPFPGTPGYGQGITRPEVIQPSGYMESKPTDIPMIQDLEVSPQVPMPTPIPTTQLPPTSPEPETDFSLPGSIVGPPPSQRQPQDSTTPPGDQRFVEAESGQIPTPTPRTTAESGISAEPEQKQYIVQRQPYLPPAKEGAEEMELELEPTTELPVDFEPLEAEEPIMYEVPEVVLPEPEMEDDPDLEMPEAEESGEKKDIVNQLERLGKLKKIGLLSEEEFEKAKKELLK